MLEVSEIKKNYESYEDHRILKIANGGVKGLRDEVVPLLLAELKKRNLDPYLIEWIKAERREISAQELETITRDVHESLCVVCNKNRDLRGISFTTVVGFLIGTSVVQYDLIICKDCGKRKKRHSTMLTSTFGWWSGEGLFTTPFALARSIKTSLEAENQSQQLIQSFIKDNIGTIRLGEDRVAVIRELLITYNIKVIR